MPIRDLVPDPRNARLHDEANIGAIEASLRQFGQRRPATVQAGSNIVTAGNGMLTAAKRLGWSHLAVLPTEDAELQARAWAIADNRTAELAAWDPDVLQAQLAELSPDALGTTDFAALLEGLSASLAESQSDGFSATDDTDGAEEVPPPILPSGDRAPFQQMTFTVHDSQAESIKAALKKAKDAGPFVGENQNSNGNALARIAEAYL